MCERKRAIKACPKKGEVPAKLIVRVVDYKNQPVNGVTVFAQHTVTGMDHYQKTEPLYRHVKAAWRVLGRSSDLDGVAHFGKNMKPGKYKVSVYSDLSESKTVMVIAGEKGRTRRNPHATLKAPALLMVLDADRDGEVDLDPLIATDHEEWTWGDEGTGAIVMAKTRTYAPDQEVAERSKITFRWTGPAGQEWDDHWGATLKVDPNAKLRIYSTKNWQAANANRVFDGTTETLDLTGVPGAADSLRDNQQLDLWLEATDFSTAVDGSDAEIKLTYSSKVAEGPEIKQTAVVRIAPWLMAGDYDPVERVYIARFPEAEVQVGVGRRLRMKNGTIAVLNDNLRQALQGHIQPVSLTLISPPPKNPSGGLHRYVRDMVRFGTHSAPRNVGTPVALRGNETVDPTLDRRLDVGCVVNGIGLVNRPRTGEATSSDCGGNLVLSPPVPPATGSTYPFGRIIYSHRAGDKNMGKSWRDFFDAQQIQKPVQIDTTWLTVGHADEVVTFVPANTGGHPYRMLLASPRRAYQILGEIDLAAVAGLRETQEAAGLLADAGHITWPVLSGDPHPVDFRAREAAQGAVAPGLQNGNGRLCFNRFLNDGTLVQKWIDQFLQDDPILSQNAGTVAKKINAVFAAATQVANDLPANCTTNEVVAPLRAKNEIAQAEGRVFTHLLVQVMLDHIRAQLQEALNINDADVVEVPILYNPSTGNMVNLLLVGKNCIVPKPYGPLMGGQDLFEQAFTTDLAGIGLTIHFINEWHEYHLDGGEIHCGTNQCPTNGSARAKQWWLHKPQDF